MSYVEIHTPAPPRRRGGGAWVVLPLLVAGYFYVHHQRERYDTFFDAAQWKASQIDADDVRVCMSPDLARRIVREGWDLSQLEARLGTPAATEQRELPDSGRTRPHTVLIYPLRRISDATSPDGAYVLYVEPRFGTQPPRVWTACLREEHVRVWEKPTTAAIMLGLDDECVSAD